MKDANAVTRADMARIPSIWQYTTPEEIPLRFVYGDRTVCGIPQEFCPRAVIRRPDSCTTQIVVTGQNDDGLEIRCEYLEYRDFPVTEWVVFFTNRSDTDTPVLSDIRLCGKLPASHPVLYHGNGDTCGRDGYTWEERAVTEEITLGTTDGTSCNGAFPYLRLRDDAGGYNIAVGWPGSWSATFAPDADGVKLEAGQWRCHMVIHPGETMRTPRMNLMAYCGDDDRGRNLWRRWYFAHILPREDGHPIGPKLCLHTFWIDGKEEFCGATEQNQINSIETYCARGLKPDIWWIDAGWYACDDTWWKIGDWHPNRENFPNGFRPVGEACDRHDIRLLVWFEPERCYEGGLLLREHPEWFMHFNEADGTPSKNYGLDLGNDEARQWLTDYVCGMIADSHIRVYRQDFNYAPMMAWSQNEAPDRIGAMENRHVQGYLRYWDDIIARNPGIWIDACASGGRRNDLETMRRAVPLHYTDVGYGEHPMKQKQHRQMFEWIPYFRAHTMSHDDADGNYLTGGSQPIDEFCYQNAMTPAITSMIEYNDSDEMFDLGRRMHRIWRRVSDLELRGDYYPLTECRLDPHDYYAMQFDDPARGDGFVQVIRNTQAQDDAFTVLMHADADCAYTFTSDDGKETFTVCGKELQKGMTVHIPRRSGRIWFYEKKETIHD